jgi:hypothetical protein
MLNPESHGGPTVQAPQGDPPADFNDMLHPGEKPKRFSSVRRAGIRKVAEARGIPDHLIEGLIDEMEKNALGWGKTLWTAGKALFSGGGKAALRTGGKMSMPGAGGWERAKQIVSKKWAQRGAMKAGRPTGMGLQANPQTGQMELPTRASAAAMSPGEAQRMRMVQSGAYKQDPVYQRILRQNQTGFERFMGGWGGTALTQIAPWIVLPLASEALGLGGAGQLAAFGGAMALPMALGGKFQGGMIRAKQAYLRGAKA